MELNLLVFFNKMDFFVLRELVVLVGVVIKKVL
jgi:hypothetical protein